MTQFKDHKIFRNAKQKADRILKNPEKLKNLINMAMSKANTMEDKKAQAGNLLARMNTFSRMLKTYIKGDYPYFPWKMLVMIVAGLLYFLMPIDAMPDFIPVTGFLDDITIIVWIFNSFKHEIDAFEAWEKSIAVRN